MFRSIEEYGFHRNLVTEIKLPIKKKLSSAGDRCHVALHEVIPNSVYIDVYQIQQLEEFSGPQILPDMDIDIEKPDYKSPPHKVYVFSKLQLNNSDFWWTRIVLPIHLRYHQAGSGHSATIAIDKPHILVRCKGFESSHISTQREAPCYANNASLCRWNLIHYSTDIESLIVTVPIGNTGDLPVVLSATIFVTVSCCLLLLWILYKLIQRNEVKSD
ncbi:uncharacterized protein LOC141904006 isoform X2 [Tubulanus polymorphus]